MHPTQTNSTGSLRQTRKLPEICGAKSSLSRYGSWEGCPLRILGFVWLSPGHDLRRRPENSQAREGGGGWLVVNLHSGFNTSKKANWVVFYFLQEAPNTGATVSTGSCPAHHGGPPYSDFALCWAHGFMAKCWREPPNPHRSPA